MVRHNEQFYVFAFLMGLNDEYAMCQSQVLMMDPIPLISRVYGLICQNEDMQKTTPPPIESPHLLSIYGFCGGHQLLEDSWQKKFFMKGSS